MELKYNNLNGEINLEIKLNGIKYSFWKIVDIKIENEFYRLFFKKMLRLPKKLRLSITFSSLFQIEWIKASNVEKNTIFEEKKILN